LQNKIQKIQFFINFHKKRKINWLS